MTAEAYPLSWPHGWPRTPVHARKPAKFSTTGTQTNGEHSWKVKRDLTMFAAMRRLQDELDRLGARNVLLSTNVELRLDGQPRSDRRPPEDCGVAVYFKLKGKDRVLACDKWDKVAGNIAAIAGHIDAIRRQDRYGVGTVEQAFAGYMQIEGPRAGRDWRAVLGFTPHEAVDLDRATEAFRRLAFSAHPDRGGSIERMSELSDAIAAVRQQFEGPR